MHRTQVYLKEGQYELLRARARREGKSLAGVIRDILDDHLSGPGKGRRVDRFAAVIGIGAGDGRAVAEDYEDYLYGAGS